MIHYPQDKVDGMISHLASLSEQRLIISFAPKTVAYTILKRIGELFPGPSKVGWHFRACLFISECAFVEKLMGGAWGVK